ncbi:MAG: ABC transporter permease [Dehalococcoidales bacterium]
MQAYFIRRLFLMIPTLLLVTILVFSVIRMIPGDVIDLMVAENADSAGMGETMDTDYVRHLLGLDVPLWEQYGRWLSGIFRGDLGQSLWGEREVFDDIMNRLPITLELGVMSLLVALLVALPIGTYSAIRQDTTGDYIGRTLGVLAISIPPFWVGTLLFVYPSIWWRWTPPIEYIKFTENPTGNLAQFIVPAIIMGMVMSGTTMRMTRTMMLEVLRQDYIRTAWSKGLRERVVVIRHALKNAMIPVVSMIGLLIPITIGGAVVIEQIFVLPGIGRLMLGSIQQRDYPVLSGINVMVAAFVLFVNLMVDMTYGWLDPRVQYR